MDGYYNLGYPNGGSYAYGVTFVPSVIRWGW
jgi:hypothetical protein